MAVTPEDILTSAKNVDISSGNEADYRSAISRYYYSGYHAAHRYHSGLSAIGKAKAGCGDHENLIHMLANPNVPQQDPSHNISIEISHYLKKCLFNRRLADYDINQPVSKKNVDIVEAEIGLIFDAT